MNTNKLEKIKKKIEELKIINYKEYEILSDSNFLKIIKGDYHLNNGHHIIRESVVKNIGLSNAVSIIALTKENKIVIVIEPRTALPDQKKVSIELPAGYIEAGETSIQSAMRELKEETGYSSNNFILLDSYYPSLGASGERIDLVLATDCVSNGVQQLDFDEYVHYEEVTIEEFKYLIDNHYMKDANSRIGYYKLLEYLNSGDQNG